MHLLSKVMTEFKGQSFNHHLIKKYATPVIQRTKVNNGWKKVCPSCHSMDIGRRHRPRWLKRIFRKKWFICRTCHKKFRS